MSVPILVSGESSTGQFSDETQTLVVNAHGALITLATPVSPEQRLTLKRRASGEEEACRVVYIGSSPEDKAKLGVEFVKPAPHFWHLAFPPKDWTPESVASEPDDSVKAPSVLPQGEVACEIDTERRRTTRYNFGAIAEVIDLGARADLVGVTRDLSLSGCFIKTNMPFPKGTEVIVRIRHSGADFAATGDVTNNITSEGMGVEFIQIAPKDRAIMESWLGLTTGRDKASSYEPLQGIPITVSGQSYRGDFSEDAETEIVIDEGALLHLSAPVSAGQVVRLKNRLTRMEQNCRVLFVDPIKQGKLSLVAVGFLEHRQQSIRGIPITVSGQSSTGEFSEETETQIVMHNGALLHLSAPVSAGQVVQVKNRLTRMERNRRVLFVDSKSGQDKSSLLAVEFLEPVQNFWGIKQKS